MGRKKPYGISLAGGRFFHVVGVVLLLAVVALPASSAVPDLSGRWAVAMVMVASGELPVVGPATVTTVIGLLTTIEQDGDTLTMQDVYCTTTMVMDPAMAETVVPDRFMQSLTPRARIAVLSNDAAGVRLAQDWQTEVRGALLANEASDPLPTDAYDPRVMDQDADGLPGLTVPVNIPDIVGGDTYVVHRLRYRLEGRVVDQDTITGTIEWTSEQNVILATDLVLMMTVSLPAAEDPSLHRFAMVRVDETWTVETVREQLDEIVARFCAEPAA